MLGRKSPMCGEKDWETPKALTAVVLTWGHRWLFFLTLTYAFPRLKNIYTCNFYKGKRNLCSG